MNSTPELQQYEHNMRGLKQRIADLETEVGKLKGMHVDDRRKIAEAEARGFNRAIGDVLALKKYYPYAPRDFMDMIHVSDIERLRRTINE